MKAVADFDLHDSTTVNSCYCKQLLSWQFITATIKTNITINKLNLTDIFRTFHPTTSEDTFFSSTHGTFSRINYVIGSKTSLYKFNGTEIILSILGQQYNKGRNQNVSIHENKYASK